MQISLGSYRRYLRHYESVLAYAVLGILGGLASGLAVIAFEYAVRGLADLWQVGRGEDFESLPRVWLFALPSLGGIIAGGWPLGLLALFAATKLLTASVRVGLGAPVGLIGPNLLIGACVGGLLGHLGISLAPELSSDPTLYVTIGMAAAMATVVGAPLAASLAVVELTQSTAIAVPALLAIVVANLTNVALFRQRPVHESIMRQLERQVPSDPLEQFLHRTDATLCMEKSVVRVPVEVSAKALWALTLQVPTWCLVHREDEDLFLVDGNDLLAWAGRHAGNRACGGLSPANVSNSFHCPA